MFGPFTGSEYRKSINHILIWAKSIDQYFDSIDRSNPFGINTLPVHALAVVWLQINAK
jgi:hypothetical protein